MRDRTISLGDLDFAAIESGEGGRPLLLVHGFGGAKEDFADHLDAFAERGWWAVAVDHRGHGASAQPADESAYSLEILADDVVGWADQLGWERHVLLGHSLGGMVAQMVALSTPHRLHGLVLMDTSDVPMALDPELTFLAAEVARNEGMAALKAAMDALDEGPLETPANRRLLAERPGYREFADRKFLSCSPAMYASLLAHLVETPARTDALASLTVPTLILVGDQDKPFLVPSRRMADTIPTAQMVVLPDGGHSPQFEAPDAWFAAMADFLDEAASRIA